MASYSVYEPGSPEGCDLPACRWMALRKQPIHRHCCFRGRAPADRSGADMSQTQSPFSGDCGIIVPGSQAVRLEKSQLCPL